MSCGTTVKVKGNTVHFNGISIASMSDLDRQIEVCNEHINICKTKLKMLAIATPKDIFPPKPDEVPDVMFYVNSEFDDVWEWLDEEMTTLVRLYEIKSMIEDWTYSYEGEETLNPNKADDFERIVPDPYKNLI